MCKSVKRSLLTLLLAAACLLSLCGCSGGTDGGNRQDDSLEKVLQAGQLVLGLDLSFPPMGFLDGNGEAIGFDIDVAREVCRRMGIALITRGIAWNEKEEDLASGRIDCIWNGFSLTPARKETMTFSDPYMKNELILVVPGSSEVKALRDLRGKRVGFQSGATAEEVLKTSEIYPDITPVPYETNMDLLEGLDRGEADAALTDSVAAYYLIFSREDQAFFILPDSLAEEEYAIGFRKGDLALRDRVQQTVSEMKKDGTLGRISEKWFGSDITIVK